MTPRTARRTRLLAAPAAALVFSLVCAWCIFTRLEQTYDLAFFLPPPETEDERVLMRRLGQGPGSRILFLELEELTPDERTEVTKALAACASVAAVLTGPATMSVPQPIWRNRYLLADPDLSRAGLARALDARLADLAVIAAEDVIELIAADPYLASLDVLEALRVLETEVPAPGAATVLAVQTRAPAYDIGAQQRALNEIRSAVVDTLGQPPAIFGVGAYSVEVADTIRSEAVWRSAIAAAVVTLLVLIAYRRMSAVWLSIVPVAMGALGGLALLSVVFERTHGITLAFGFTLFGVAVDYPMHVLSHARGDPVRDVRAIWPTLRLAGASTLMAYLVFVLAGSRGLVQLGCFSAAGIAVALAATRWVLPSLVALTGFSRAGAAPATPASAGRVRHAPWIVALILSTAVIAAGGIDWQVSLQSMTPLPDAVLAKDRHLREIAGAPDMRYLVSTRAADRDAALAATERLATVLAEARARGVLTGYRAVTALLPSRATFAARRAALAAAAPDIERRLQAAATARGFDPAAFAPFVRDLRTMARRDRPIVPADYRGTPLAQLLGSMLMRDGRDWLTVTTLAGVADAPALAARIEAAAPSSTLVDLKAASDGLLVEYRERIVTALAAALAAIALGLAVTVRPLRRLVWVAGVLAAATTACLALSALVLETLSLFDLMALTLVAGLGLDYALFFSREAGASDTRHSVAVCAASTLAVFGVLGLSSIPILNGIGTTVTIGVACSYLLARFGQARSVAQPAIAPETWS